MELATPFNRRLVSSTPDPEKIPPTPAVFFSEAKQDDGSDSDESTLIGDADYLNDDLEEECKHDNRPNLKQKPGAKASKPSVGKGHREAAPRRTSSAPNSSSASGPQGLGSQGRAAPPHPLSGIPSLDNNLTACAKFSPSPSCLPKALGIPDKLPTMNSAPLALPLRSADTAGVNRSKGMVILPLDRQPSGFVQIGSIPGSMRGRRSGSCSSLAEAMDPRPLQGLIQAPVPREDGYAPRGRAILGRKAQPVETATSDPRTQTQLPASCTAASPKCLPSPTECGVRSAFPGAPEEGSSPPAAEPHCHQGPRKGGDEVSAAADQPCISQTAGQGDASGPLPSGRQPPTPGSQARPRGDAKMVRPVPRRVSLREAEELDDEVFGINNPPVRPGGGSLVESLSSHKWMGPYNPYSPPPLCANGSIHPCPPNPRFSPTVLPNSPTSPTPPTTSPPRLSPMPFAQAAGEFNSNARLRGRCEGQGQSALSQLGEARPVHAGLVASQLPTQQTRLEELNRAIHNTIQMLRNRGQEEGAGSEWEQAGRELEEAAKNCPYLRPGFLTAEQETSSQFWRNQVAQLNRRVKTLNAQLSERERQIRDMRRPASEADREEQNEERLLLQQQLRGVVQKLQETERQAEIFQQENMQLREERVRWPDRRQQEDEVRRLRQELEASQQTVQRLGRSKAQQQQAEREQQERVLALSTQTTLLQDENARLQKENTEIKARLATMQSQLKRAQEESERERERRREEMQRQDTEMQRRMAAVQECCAAQRSADELRDELRSLKEEHLHLRKDYEAVTSKLVRVEEINRTLKEGVATVLRRVEQGGSNGCSSSSKSPPQDNLQHMLRCLCAHPQPSPTRTSQSSAGPKSPQRHQAGDRSDVSSLETGPLSGQSSMLGSGGPRADPQHSPNGLVEQEAGPTRGMLSSSKGFSLLSPSKAAPSSPSTSTSLPKSYLDRSTLAHSGPLTSSPLQQGKSGEEDTSLYCISKKFLKGPRYPPSVEKERAGDLAGSPVDSSWDSEFENNNDPKTTSNMKSVPGTGQQESTTPARPFEGTQLDVSLSTIQAETESVSSEFSQSPSSSTPGQIFVNRIHNVDQEMAEALTRLRSNNF